MKLIDVRNSDWTQGLDGLKFAHSNPNNYFSYFAISYSWERNSEDVDRKLELIPDIHAQLASNNFYIDYCWLDIVSMLPSGVSEGDRSVLLKCLEYVYKNAEQVVVCPTLHIGNWDSAMGRWLRGRCTTQELQSGNSRAIFVMDASGRLVPWCSLEEHYFLLMVEKDDMNL